MMSGTLAAPDATPAAAAPGWLAYPRLRRAAIAALTPLFLAGGLLAWAAIRLLEPWRRVRVGMLPYDRIGHLAVNVERFLRDRAAAPEERVVSLFTSGPPANEQLLTMIARRVPVARSPWALRFYMHGLRPFIEGGRFHEPLPFGSNEYASFAAAGPQLSFLPEERARGERLLEDMGVPAGAPFVCFHARDKSYLDRLHAGRPPEQRTHHDYRDCAIEGYLAAAERLAERGTFALRMGSVVAAPIRPRSPRVVDYATRFRSDFGDVYLPSRCKFFLGNTSGLMCLAASFDVPAALANFAPLGYAPWREGDLFIPKTYRRTKDGSPIPFREIVAQGASRWIDSERFAAAGIELVENTAEEIAELADEMDARVDGRWREAAEDDELQRRFRALFPPEHPITGYPSRVGALFLRRHRELL